MSADKLSPADLQSISKDITERFRSAWHVVSSQHEGGTSLRDIADVFVKSVFKPELLIELSSGPSEMGIIGRLKTPGKHESVGMSDSNLEAARKELVQGILDAEPVLVPGADQAIKELVDKSDFHIWTVGDYVGTQDLQEQADTAYEGSGHQLWKLWQAGLTNRQDIDIHVADNKFSALLPELSTLTARGIEHFTFFDDRVSNLKRLKTIIDQENINREMAGDPPLNCKLVLVNQGSRKSTNPEQIGTQGSLVEYSVINSFADAPKELPNIDESKQATFCDFDGTITDNVEVRASWDKVANEIVNKYTELNKLKNPQKEKSATTIEDRDISLAAVLAYVEQCRAKGLRIGIKNGAYDLLQPGHVEGFQVAKEACDILIVLINSDESINKYKGTKVGVPRPIVDQRQRAATLLGLDAVDGVIMFEEENPAGIMEAIRPDVYITSEEYRGRSLAEFDAAARIGADVVYTNYVSGFSTSGIVERIFLAAKDSVKAEYEN